MLTVLMLSLLAGCLAVYYPSVNVKSTIFSYRRAKEDIKVISKEPHSTLYHQEALEVVRQYIVKELEAINMNPKVFSYKAVENDRGDIADIHNIYGKMDGKNGEAGTYILLVAHYDSAGTNPQNDEGFSHGAADDGYGVATILEILKNIKASDKILKNGIKVLITDGEEMHLVGSRQELDSNFSVYENVSYVINLEARGSSGPVIMFQISEKNSRVLDLYKKANFPVTSSLITDLFKESSRSDFFHMKKKGLDGINFTTLDKVEYYHTPEDSYNNISDKSLMHYGNQVLPIVEEFVYSVKYSDIDYFEKGTDSIFFTFLPNIVLDYSVSLGRVLTIIIMLIVIVLMKQNSEKMKGILKSLGKNLIQVISSFILGFIISFGLANVSGVNFILNHMGKVPGDDFFAIVLPLFVFLFMFRLELKKKDNLREKFYAGVLMQTILLFISIVFLPGASYLTMIPLLFLIFSLAIIRIITIDILKYTLLFAIATMIILYVPLLYILHIAFSIGALPFIFAMFMIMKSLIIPVILYLYDSSPRKADETSNQENI